jgi:hypothetical protein
MALVRIKEIGACVDKMAFVQPSFSFGTGEAVADRPRFPLELAQRASARTDLVSIHSVGGASVDRECANLSARGLALPWCRQSFARNALFEAFQRLGGGDDDVALISDADELPRAPALQQLRARLRGDDEVDLGPGVWSLAAPRTFHYSFHCEDPSEWVLGPRAVLGSVLRMYGAQAVRLGNRYLCWPSGYHASCPERRRPPHRVRYQTISNGSWHLSSVSGGVRGHLRKVRDNSFRVAASLLAEEEVVRRAQHCHDHLGRDGRTPNPHRPYFTPTAWSATNLPSYPVVPSVVDDALRRHPEETSHLLDARRPFAPGLLEVLTSLSSVEECGTSGTATDARPSPPPAPAPTPAPPTLEWPWCLVMSDDRRPEKLPASGAHRVCSAAAYARSHGYGFQYALWSAAPNRSDAAANAASASASAPRRGCVHDRRGALSPMWCKIPAIAHAMIRGIGGRRCNRLLYLDSDVAILNSSMSLDEYMEFGKRAGDEALQEGLADWQLLFTSNAPHRDAGLCTGLFFVRNDDLACGILRNWWDADWPDEPRWSWEQGAMAEGVHAYHRAYGEAVRLMPTSVTWRWTEIPKMASMPRRAPLNADVLFHHQCSRPSPDPHGNCAAAPVPPGARTPRDAAADGKYLCGSHALNVEHLRGHEAGRSFDAGVRGLEGGSSPTPPASCAPAKPRDGIGFDFMSAARCCRRGKRMPMSRYHLNGSRSSGPRPCWWVGRGGTEEKWSCGRSELIN